MKSFIGLIHTDFQAILIGISIYYRLLRLIMSFPMSIPIPIEGAPSFPLSTIIID